jgi:hypothetical protein
MLLRWLVFCTIPLLPLASSSAQTLTPHQQNAFDIYKELVEINTVTATCDTERPVEAMAAHLRAAGFTDSDVQVFSPVPRNAQGNNAPAIGLCVRRTPFWWAGFKPPDLVGCRLAQSGRDSFVRAGFHSTWSRGPPGSAKTVQPIGLPIPKRPTQARRPSRGGTRLCCWRVPRTAS